VVIAAAQAGKHIFTEKVIAPTLREVNEILAAVEHAGVKFMVSLPRLYHGSTQAIRDILAQQLLGDVTLVRIRISHDGALRTKDHPEGWLPAHFFSLEQCAGGAMIDLGCHPMYLSSVFLGMPESVTASYGYVTGREVEDNASATLNYANGSIGVAESSFVNPFSPFTIEIHGTEGSLFYGGPEGHLLIRSSRLSDGGQDWQDWTTRIPQDRPLAFSQWVNHIQQGTTATENIQVAVNLTSLMEAANISARTRCVVRLSSL
jgi:predicted dehydrogenase